MVTSLVHIPKLVAALHTMHRIRLVGMPIAGTTGGAFGFISGSSIIRNALGVLGLAGIVDLVLDLFPDRDDQDEIAELVNDLMESGFIDVADKRRGDDSNAVPAIFIMDLSGGLNRGKPFMVWEYFSRNFVKAVRKNERTPRYAGRPRPQGRRSRSSR